MLPFNIIKNIILTAKDLILTFSGKKKKKKESVLCSVSQSQVFYCFNKYQLSTYLYLPDIMPGPGYPVVNKTDQVPVQWTVQFTEGNQHQTNRQTSWHIITNFYKIYEWKSKPDGKLENKRDYSRWVISKDLFEKIILKPRAITRRLI